MADEELKEFVEEIGLGSHLKVEEDLGDGFVRLRRSEAERRQAAQDIRCTEDIIVEILRNAHDAHASSIFIATNRSDMHRSIVCIDDGDGIPEHLHGLIFDARVTSKLTSVHMDKWGIHGRGMALYAVKQNATDARVVVSAPGKGTSIRIETDLASLPEKADQSSFPQFQRSDDGVVQVKGVRNILRTTCEFALEYRQSVDVYIGSPIEIAATLYALGFDHAHHDDVFGTTYDELPYCWRPAFCSKASELAAVCESLGLAVSERSAHRILDDEIAPLDPMTDLVRMALAPQAKPDDEEKHRSTRAKTMPTTHIRPHDVDEFKAEIAGDYAELAASYYLKGDVDITVTVRRNRIHIDIPLVPDET